MNEFNQKLESINEEEEKITSTPSRTKIGESLSEALSDESSQCSQSLSRESISNIVLLSSIGSEQQRTNTHSLHIMIG